MILTCPECATRYQTDAAHFTPSGRKVRCAKCGHVWFQSEPVPEPEPETVRVEEPREFARKPTTSGRVLYAPAIAERKRVAAAPPQPHPPLRLERLGLVLGWAALGVIVFAVGWSGLRYRQDIASLWPQSSSLYAAVGMRVNTRGIEFRDKDAHFETENGQSVLVITGDIVNITAHELTVPPIRVSLSDGDKRELYHWNFSSGVATLNPGQTVSFHTRLPSPPPAARHIELRFAERGT